MLETTNPFHPGEIEAQERAGVVDLAARVGSFVRDHMPDQHRTFFESLPFLVVAAADSHGRPWVTIIEGPDGFVSSPDPRTLSLKTDIDPLDPLADAFAAGTDVGMVGIELATRRRNRMNGRLRPTDQGYAINVSQSFGNCPQYINERAWHRVDAGPSQTKISEALSADHFRLIQAADTMFIGSGQGATADSPSGGYDASHRGGQRGFVEIIDGTHLRIPDYAGNNFFNTIGNILKNPRVALLFVDFETGGLLHLSGEAKIDWHPQNQGETGAHRTIDVSLTQVVERPGALQLRWDADGEAVRHLRLAGKVRETEQITSFYLEPVDSRPLAPFKAGQHLTIDLRLAPPLGTVKRSYSLSATSNGHYYRLSIKREPKGLVSRVMHDMLRPGSVIEARAPAGDFELPDGEDPVVLASAGVGITPLMAMLQEIAHHQKDRLTWFVHSARNGSSHAMRDEVRALRKRNIQTQIFYSQPREEDRIGHDYDRAGRITAKALLGLNAGPKAHYLLCGPAGFVAALQGGLEAASVPLAQIRIETF